MMPLTGRWRIVDMELRDADAIDLVSPGFIEFDRVRLGRLGFIAVNGQLDWREVVRDGRPGVEFTWEGADEGDPVSNRLSSWTFMAARRSRMRSMIPAACSGRSCSSATSG